MWEAQAATDRLYKLWDTEETPQLLLLALAFSAATAQPNIWVNKAADLPYPHQRRPFCLTGRMSRTNDALMPTHANTKWHCVWSHLRLKVMVCFVLFFLTTNKTTAENTVPDFKTKSSINGSTDKRITILLLMLMVNLVNPKWGLKFYETNSEIISSPHCWPHVWFSSATGWFSAAPHKPCLSISYHTLFNA